MNRIITCEELCRNAAHNLAERTLVENALEEECSKTRYVYLRHRLKELHEERGRMMAKWKRIKHHNHLEYEFII